MKALEVHTVLEVLLTLFIESMVNNGSRGVEYVLWTIFGN